MQWILMDTRRKIIGHAIKVETPENRLNLKVQQHIPAFIQIPSQGPGGNSRCSMKNVVQCYGIVISQACSNITDWVAGRTRESRATIMVQKKFFSINALILYNYREL